MPHRPLSTAAADVAAISTHMAIQFEPAARAYTARLLKI
ncbi:hypothetical protein CLV72_104692 [Allonocardiopsis opalescens]|uniref:Uncharacterized protein n=1 Tax=Allonocardiopsis opalescens TaxID=1144618 RepID=A0A2T0Q5P7_9ACTN|nr:hypothetical protein CLV72_104692 [Allonocardiopsis opalescens]